MTKMNNIYINIGNISRTHKLGLCGETIISAVGLIKEVVVLINPRMDSDQQIFQAWHDIMIED